MVITTNLNFYEWAHALGDQKRTTALVARLTYRCHIVESGDDGYRF
ncbi:ATP-binding protein [Vannielia sp. SX4]